MDVHQQVEDATARDVARVTTDSQRELSLTAESRASCEAVYDTLVDAGTHLEWAGRGQPTYFRLLSFEGPDGRLTVGASFSSTGSIPGTGRQFHDRSRVVVAEPPTLFEFITESTVPGRKPMQATFRHRYELEPNGEAAASGTRSARRASSIRCCGSACRSFATSPGS